MRADLRGLFVIMLLCGLVMAPVTPTYANTTSPEPDRFFQFVYNVEVEAIPEGQGPIDLFVPLAKSDTRQEILSRKVEISAPGEVKTEPMYGNEFYHAHLDKSDGKPITIKVTYNVRRSPFHRNVQSKSIESSYSAEEFKQVDRFLQADALVPVSGELIEKIQKDLPKTGKEPAARARAIYDYVVDTMEYKKVGTGWGNGDFYWACSQKYGNCTDFHSLFIGLARAEKIPAKFEIGFSVPEDKDAGEIGGYHCWAEFLLPKVGWTPIDASEAKKNLAKRDLFFGTHPADRIQFSVGRDIRLGEGHKTKPLNYFIFPHVEVNGEKYDKLKKQFSYGPLAEEDRQPAVVVNTTAPGK